MAGIPGCSTRRIARLDGPAADGDVVDLVNDAGKFVARGIYNSQSRIRVRLYTWDINQPLDESFWRSRLETAVQLRRELGLDAADGAARLVFSEADGLSGLVVDRYADWLAVQVTGLGIARRLGHICVDPPRAGRSARHLHPHRKRSGQRRRHRAARRVDIGAKHREGPAFIVENGLRYGVDLAEGQKTGFYLDQRDNRRAAAGLLARAARARHVLLQRRRSA